MTTIATYGATYLPGLNKVSKMRADANGYYRTVVGGFDMRSTKGELYHLTESVKALFAKGSILRRRVDNGVCRGEEMHPTISNLSHADAIKRLLTIELSKVSHHMRDFSLEAKKDHSGNDVVLVYASVKPSGPCGASLEASLQNREENVAFSIRSFSNPGIKNGVPGTIVTDILTYDQVPEAGIELATQFDSVSLESIVDPIHFTSKDFDDAISATDGVSSESDNGIITMVRDNVLGGWEQVQIVKVGRSINW